MMMGLDNYILFEIIIVLYSCQLLRPIQSEEDSYYYYEEEDDISIQGGKKVDINTTDPGASVLNSSQKRDLQFRVDDEQLKREGEKTEGEKKEGEKKEDDIKVGEKKGEGKKEGNKLLRQRKSPQTEAQMEEMMKNMSKFKQDTYDKSAQGWENFFQNALFGWEYTSGVRHIGERDDKTRACYYIGTSYQNAITDIRHYFRIRYLYVENLHYEVGFLTHEIVFKYQIMLEMFHIVQGRFHYNRTRYYAPTTYMFYMYSNILDMSKQIIHLCNMLHEVEKKYHNHPKTVFQDYHLLKKDKSKDKHNALSDRMKMLEKARKDQYKMRMRELKKKRNAMVLSGLVTKAMSTRRRTRKTRDGWLHYGWSIEDW